MFTGIISGLGRIDDIRTLGADDRHGRQLAIAAPPGYLDDVQLGDSIAVNGACLTVTGFDGPGSGAGRFTVDVSTESLARTAGLDGPGPVNLEKAMRANDRLGGHLVSGHVDGIGTVSHVAAAGESTELRIRTPAALARFIAYKGSITVDGVSLTVNRVTDLATEERIDAEAEEARRSTESAAGAETGSHTGGRADACELSINLIPHSLQHTTLGTLVPGRRVNLEIDLIARYVERMLTAPKAH